MSAIINHILKKKSIVDYLNKKGHKYVKSMSNGRISYLCPFPDHKESQPSFVVWTNGDYENFYCFGCNRGHTIIHLISYIENISYRESLNKLSDGIEINTEEDISYTIDHIPWIANKENDIRLVLFDMSNITRLYLESVEYDSSEVNIIDKFWTEIDKYIISCDFETIENSCKYLKSIIELRRNKWKLIHRNVNRKAVYDSI